MPWIFITVMVLVGGALALLLLARPGSILWWLGVVFGATYAGLRLYWGSFSGPERKSNLEKRRPRHKTIK